MKCFPQTCNVEFFSASWQAVKFFRLIFDSHWLLLSLESSSDLLSVVKMLGKRKNPAFGAFFLLLKLLLHRQCCSPCFCRFVLLFMIRAFYFYPPIMAATKHYVILSGMTGTVYMTFNFDGSPQNYLTILEAFWTSMLHCFWPVVQISREICSRETVLARCLWSLSLTYAMFMKFLLMIGCIHSIWVG